MNLRVLFPVLLLGVVSAGCAAVKVVEHTDTQNYYDGAFEFATQNGEINTYIAGAPFAGEDAIARFKFRVFSKLYRSTFGRDVNFKPSKPNSEKYGFHVVITFNAVNHLSAGDICEDATQIKSRANLKTTSMLSVFCQGAHPISYSRGYVGSLSGPDDPKLESLVRGVAQAMIPLYDDHHSANDISPL
jgi:hypothetical protein